MNAFFLLSSSTFSFSHAYSLRLIARGGKERVLVVESKEREREERKRERERARERASERESEQERAR
jgi:hypothetical protein